MLLDEILNEAIEVGASDVLLKPGAPPAFRIRGELRPPADRPPLSPAAVQEIADAAFGDYQRHRFAAERQVDMAYEVAGRRFRLNFFQQRGQLCAAIRVVPAAIRSIAELHLPAVVERIADERRGLVLVTGATGCGKSTTLAAMIDHINKTRHAHVVTIEDPIEYVHADDHSFITQREVGSDTTSFASGLKAALRQNPDVILVGEMRDLETIETALLAAETGHLVMSTLHTLDAPQSITRTINVFPEHLREQMRLVLSTVLRAVISQRLLPRCDGDGLVPAVEVLVSTERVRDYIADKTKTPDLREVIAQGHTAYGMQTFDQSLMALLQAGLISYEEAMAHATSPGDFALKVRGLSGTSDRRWSDFERPAGSANGIEVERF